MALTDAQRKAGRAWRSWFDKRDSFPQHRIPTVIGILGLSDCVYEPGGPAGPTAFANFAYYRAGRADLAGENVDDATATGIRKAAAVQALLAKHGQAGLLRDDAASIVEAVWAGVTRVPAAQAHAAPAPPATPMQAAPHAATPGAEPVAESGLGMAAPGSAVDMEVCERCPRQGLPMPVGAFVECGIKALCAQGYATSDAPAPGSLVAHFAVKRTDVPPTFPYCPADSPSEAGPARQCGSAAHDARTALVRWLNVRWLNHRLDYANAPCVLPPVDEIANFLAEATIDGEPVTGKALLEYFGRDAEGCVQFLEGLGLDGPTALQLRDGPPASAPGANGHLPEPATGLKRNHHSCQLTDVASDVDDAASPQHLAKALRLAGTCTHRHVRS